MFSDDLAVRVAAAEPLWAAVDEWPEIERWIGADSTPALRAGVPVLRDIGESAVGQYLRPPGHRRAFYIPQPGGGVLAIKGSEPLALNFAAFLDELAASRTHVELRLGTPAIDRTLSRAVLSGLDKLLVVEGKLPGCVTAREALGEARAALAVQRAYIARHGEPARLPLPIFVGRWPAEQRTAVRDALHARTHGRARELIDVAAADGIAVYAYRYPALPVRLAHVTLPDATDGRAFARRLAELGRHVDPRRIVEGWLGLTARLLALGFVAKDPAAVVTGDALQVQNACLDGGFADVESMIPSTQLDERALRDALRRTVAELASSATRLLAGLAVSTVDLRDRVPDLVALVWADLRTRVAAEPATDPRIADILAASDTYAALVRTLELVL